MTQALTNFQGKKVFLTGHTGFKGSWMLAVLNALGAKVKGFALQPTHSRELYEAINGDAICESVIADIRDRQRLEKEILSFQPDFIFHLAAQPLVRESYASPSETFEVNVLGTSYVLESALLLTNPCTIIVITTDKVYENKETGIYYTETDVLGGHDPYSTSKACAELVSRSFLRSFLSDNSIHTITTARAGNVIGGGDYSTNRIIPDFIQSIRENEPLEIRNPKAVRPWQHVLEPIIGYLQLALKKRENQTAIGDSYNFGPKEQDHLHVEDLIKHAIAYVGKGNYTVDKTDQLHEANELRLNINAAQKDIYWSPKYDAAKAIELTMDWYFANDKKKVTFDQIKNYLNEI